MKLLIVVYLLACGWFADAQTAIRAKVLDRETREVLIGVNIFFIKDYSQGTTTDFNGEFEVSVTKEQMTDTLLFSYMGYKEQMISVGELDETVYLEAKDLEMDAIEVVAEPLIAEEFKFEKVNKLEIYTNPASKADPLLAVNSMPASTTTDESASISLRGSSSIETGIFLNNVPVYDVIRYSQLNGVGAFSLFNTALIKNVTVFPGNPPLEFGNSTAGVVSIVTDDDAIKSSNSSLIISPASIGLQRNQRLGSQNLKLFSNYQPSTLLKWINPKALPKLNSFRSIDAGAYLYGQLTTKLNYKSYNYVLLENYDYQFLHPTFEGSILQKRKKAINVSNLYWNTPIGTFSWNQGYSFTSGNYTYSLADFNVNYRTFFQAFVYSKVMEKWQVKSGLQLDINHSEIQGVLFQYPYAVGASFPLNTIDHGNKSSTVELFAYGKYYFTDDLILGGGVRKNLNREIHDYLSAQMNMTYLLDNNWKVILGGGRFHKYGVDTDQGQLVFVRSDQLSADIFYAHSGTDASVSFFNKHTTLNGVKLPVSGLELFLDQRLSSRWSFDVSYTYLTTQEGSAFDISYFFKSNLKYQKNNWTLATNSIFREGLGYFSVINAQNDSELGVFYPIYSDHLSQYHDYFIINLSISKLIPISEDLTMVAFGSINNLTDHENVRGYRYNFDYTNSTAQYFSRRMIYAGIQINF
ncbi:MAG: hypothetical protein CMB80_33415 [Flammeovirgaceae bacterium]|nr:hypothetical protein [Flammeovirgaceae bacterium]|tara:strand:+ start:3316 stop:5394 length:2079 start_codon:yes stop_codon:yes gene_type:complete